MNFVVALFIASIRREPQEIEIWLLTGLVFGEMDLILF
jgi:hypothetical protein